LARQRDLAFGGSVRLQSLPSSKNLPLRRPIPRGRQVELARRRKFIAD